MSCDIYSTSYKHKRTKDIFVWILFTWEYFTYVETSSLPMKNCKFLTLLGTFGHWAVRFFFSHAYCVTWHFRGFLTPTSNSKRLAVELSLPVLKDLDLSRLGFKHTTFRFQGERSSQLLSRQIQKKTEKYTVSKSFIFPFHLATFK